MYFMVVTMALVLVVRTQPAMIIPSVPIRRMCRYDECADIVECISSSCDADANCKNENGSFTCSC